MESIPEISLGTAAIVIFGISVGYIFLRGLVRTFISTAFLLVSAWVGFRAWQYSPTLAFDFTGSETPLITIGLPVMAGLATFLILRKIAKLILRPIPKSDGEESEARSGGILFRLLAAVVPTLLIFLAVAAFIRHGGAIEEIQDSIKPNENPSAVSQLSTAISTALPDWVMQKLDPTTTSPRVKLVKWLISNQKAAELEPVIDPETGQPYPRAIIVDDPELKTLVDEGRVSALLRHPLVSEALKDPAIRERLGLD